MHDRKKIEDIKNKYPKGTRICLDRIDCNLTKNPVPPGTTGTITKVDENGDIYVDWSYYRDKAVCLIDGVDEFHIIEQEEDIEQNEELRIKDISLNELFDMQNKEGLILRGCYGDLYECAANLNKMLHDEKILDQHSSYKNAFSFKYEDMNCLLFPFKDEKVDIGKLSVWCNSSNCEFAPIWLSDFINSPFYSIPNERKPDCALIGQDGNIHDLMRIASQTLKDYGMSDQAKEMCDRVIQSDGYDEALRVIGDYVNITSVYDDEEEDMDEYMDENMEEEPEMGMDMSF